MNHHRVVGWGLSSIHSCCTNLLEHPSLRRSHGCLALNQHPPLLYQVPGMPFPETLTWLVLLAISVSVQMLSSQVLPWPSVLIQFRFHLSSFYPHAPFHFLHGHFIFLVEFFFFLTVSLSHQNVWFITAGPWLSRLSFALVHNSPGIEQVVSQYLYS